MLLEDVLAPNLKVVFCGTALGRTSFARKAYYAHERNLFWQTIFDVGLTNRRIHADEFKQVLDFRIGLTDLCKTNFGNDHELSRSVFNRVALRAKIEQYKPAVVAFTSKNAGRIMFGSRAGFGLHYERLGDTCVYILPSTSPMARWNWKANFHHWDAFGRAITEFR